MPLAFFFYDYNISFPLTFPLLEPSIYCSCSFCQMYGLFFYSLFHMCARYVHVCMLIWRWITSWCALPGDHFYPLFAPLACSSLCRSFYKFLKAVCGLVCLWGRWKAQLRMCLSELKAHHTWEKSRAERLQTLRVQAHRRSLGTDPNPTDSPQVPLLKAINAIGCYGGKLHTFFALPTSDKIPTSPPRKRSGDSLQNRQRMIPTKGRRARLRCSQHNTRELLLWGAGAGGLEFFLT